MIRLWLSRSSVIPLREQLCAQIILGTVSGRLTPGERLPTVRELARRVGIHPNTVSAAYQDLVKRSWLRLKRGSGVFVRELGPVPPDQDLDPMVRGWLEEAAARGFTLPEIEAALARLKSEPGPQALTLLVVHRDLPLAAVLAAEIAESLPDIPVSHAGLAGPLPPCSDNVCLLFTATCADDALRQYRPALHRVITLKSLEELLAGHRSASPAILIGVVSRSQSIRDWSVTLLSALGIPGVEVLPRDPAETGFADGLRACGLIIADVLAAQELQAHRIKVDTLRMGSAGFLTQVQGLVTQQKPSQAVSGKELNGLTLSP